VTDREAPEFDPEDVRGLLYEYRMLRLGMVAILAFGTALISYFGWPTKEWDAWRHHVAPRLISCGPHWSTGNGSNTSPTSFAYV